MKKTFTQTVLPEEAPITRETLDKINVFTRRPLSAEEVYTFTVKLCDNEVDRDCDRLALPSLDTLAKLYVGKTGLFDHELRADNQFARVYDAYVCTEPGRVTSCGEPYTYVRASAYIPRIEKYAPLISEIDCGIKKETSIHCDCGSVICSVCGADLRRAPCTHRAGESVGGKLCHRILSDVRDVYEWSFVAVPAQREAGVTKTFTSKEETSMQDILKSVREAQNSLTLDEEALRALRCRLDTLESDAAAGKVYKAHLIAEAVRCGTTAMPGLSGEVLERICAGLAAEDLQILCKHLQTAAEKKLPLSPQLAVSPTDHTENNAFRI